MNHRSHHLESNTVLDLGCLLDHDATALDRSLRCIVSEMTGQPKRSAGSTPEPAGDCTSSNLLWKQFDEKVVTSSSEQTGSVDALVEKQQYLQHKNIERHENPLHWWEQNSQHIPCLQDLAKKYLCVPGTSVSSERQGGAC